MKKKILTFFAVTSVLVVGALTFSSKEKIDFSNVLGESGNNYTLTIDNTFSKIGDTKNLKGTTQGGNSVFVNVDSSVETASGSLVTFPTNSQTGTACIDFFEDYNFSNHFRFHNLKTLSLFANGSGSGKVNIYGAKNFIGDNDFELLYEDQSFTKVSDGKYKIVADLAKFDINYIKISSPTIKNYAVMSFTSISIDYTCERNGNDYDDVLTYLEIDDTNVKKEYKIGEELDTTGLKVYAHYTISKRVDVTKFVEVSHYDFSSSGNKTIMLTYGSLSSSFDVEVLEETSSTQLNISGTYTLTIKGTWSTSYYYLVLNNDHTGYETISGKNYTFTWVLNDKIVTFNRADDLDSTSSGFIFYSSSSQVLVQTNTGTLSDDGSIHIIIKGTERTFIKG